MKAKTMNDLPETIVTIHRRLDDQRQAEWEAKAARWLAAGCAALMLALVLIG
jgi:anti-anti-sigma regulatory factor